MESREVLVLAIGVLSILLGLLIMIFPRILAFMVGAYFIVIGVLWIVRAYA